ncbi:hypothetical protein BOX15_Mlig013043g1 [Macrostomum lignano]|uniref:Uncharacterized protein n=1 Tax=Macrostomum lignano TaxID=282301 RepID=A0A267F2Q6_9PLAT|nr:hypothetical protein BOX15_Mlig013043g1 [Macrostomum lignano]
MPACPGPEAGHKRIALSAAVGSNSALSAQQQQQREQQSHKQQFMKEFSDYEPAAGSGQKNSDNESVRTEDFANKFSQMLVGADRGAVGGVGGAGGSRGMTDADSVKTEDFAREFRKALVQPRDAPSSKSGSAGGYRPLSSMRSRPPPPLLLRDGDSESVKTEDLENKFRSLMVRGPPPPVSAYDDSYVSSSDSNVRAQLLKDRVGSLMRAPAGATRLPAIDPLSDSETERTERRLQELRQARALRESCPPKAAAPRVTSLSAGRRTGSPTRVSDSRSRTRISPIKEVPLSRSLQREEFLEEEAAAAAAAAAAAEDCAMEDDEFANEVRYQSRLIQRELEQERRRRLARDRSASPLRQPATPRESLDRKVHELDELNFQVRKTLQEKEKILAELHYVQDCLRKHQAEVRLSEKLSKDNKSRADDTKTELMLAEMRRDSAAKELDGLNEELHQKKEQLKRMEESCRSRMKELQDLESIGIAREEIENILAERDELYQLIRQNEDAEFERYELEKKLTQTREEMQTQASMAQQKVIALEEELEASLTKIAETTEDRNTLKMRLSDMDEKMRVLGSSLDDLTEANRRLARAKELAEKERAEEVERLKQRMQTDLAQIQRRTEDEELAFKRQIQQLKESLEGAQSELTRKDEINCALREQIAHLEHELGHEAETKTHLISETERHLQKTGAEAERRLEAVRQEMRKEAEERLKRERATWQAEAAKEARTAQEKLQRTISELEFQLSSKDEDLSSLQEALKSKEAEAKAAEQDFRTELRERLRATVRSEKEKWEKESSERWRRELGALKEETSRTIESLQAESAKKSETIASLEAALERVSGELEAERESSKAAQRDRQTAVSRARESAREEAAREVRSVREQCESAAQEELQRERERARSAEAALSAARAELGESGRREAELAGLLEKLERAVVGQANAECARIAQVLGVTPRKVAAGSYRQQPSAEQPASPKEHRTNPVTAALANLEACGEELRTYTSELLEQSQKHRDRLAQEVKAREDDAARLGAEKTAELQAQRERLIGEHMAEIAKMAKAQNESLETSVKEKEAEVRELRANMKKWKSDTAERLAVRLQEEFRREFDKKIRDLRNAVRSKDQELQSYRKEADPAQARPKNFEASGGDPSSAVVAQLQERVRSLREENLGLRKTLFNRSAASPPELLPSRGHPAAAAATAAASKTAASAPQQAATRLSSGSLASLPRAAAAAENSESYVQHLESKLRALEDRVRRAEQHSEQLNSKDRINSITRQQQQQQQPHPYSSATVGGDRTPLAASNHSAQSSARPGSRGSFRASSSNQGGSGR